MKRPILLTLAIFALLGATNSWKCSRSATSSQDAEEVLPKDETTKNIRIAIVPKGSRAYYWKSVKAGAMKAAKDLNIDIVWMPPAKDEDKEAQNHILERCITEKFNGVVMAPADINASALPVKNIVNAGIPVVVMDSDLNSEDYTCFVGTDNAYAGKLCAWQMAKLLNGSGRVAVLRFVEGSASTTMREEAFIQILKEVAPNIQLVSTNRYSGGTIESAFYEGEALLNQFKDLDGVFCPSELSTSGFLRALQHSGRAGKIKFVGMDINTSLMQGLYDQEVSALAIQSPFNTGYLSVVKIVETIKGKENSKKIYTNVMMVDRENLDKKEIREQIVNPEMYNLLQE